jgi:Secretion system C-terminal sorting domain
MLFSLTAQSQEGQTPQCADIELTPEEFVQLPYFGLSEAQLSTYSNQLQEYTNDASRGSSSCGLGESYVYMPIAIYDHTTAGLTQAQLDGLIAATNNIYAELNLKFKFFVSCHEVPIFSPFGTVTAFTAPFQTMFPNVPNAINLHIVNSINGAGGYYNITGNNIVIPISAVPGTIPTPGTGSDPSTLAYELGHYFGLLLHTHAFAKDAPGPTHVCRREPVSRTRTFNPYALIPLWGTVCLPSNIVNTFVGKKMCEVTGDGFCDTPADPHLPGKLSVCTYIGTTLDLFNDTYSPDTHNLMSYTNPSCLTSVGPPTLSPSQKAVIAQTLFGKQDFIIDYNNSTSTLPDQYEPDNVDATGGGNEIKIGETQCHTFYKGSQKVVSFPTSSSCGDDTDILVFRSSEKSTVSTLTFSVWLSSCVDKVSIYYFVGGARGTLAQGVTQNGFDFTIPCDIASTNDFLVEIKRKADIEEGQYYASLTASNPMTTTGDSYYCLNQTKVPELSITGLPQGATVTWSSNQFTLTPNGNNCFVNTLLSGNLIPKPFVRATVSYNGCEEELIHYFSLLDPGVPPQTEIKASLPCFPKSPTGCFYLSGYNSLYQYNWTALTGTVIKNTKDIFCVDFGSNSTVSTGITLDIIDPCGNYVATKSVYVPNTKCNSILGLTIFPNPTIDVINIKILDKTEQSGGYKVFITDNSGTIIHAEETTNTEFSLNADKYEAGIYHCHITKGDEHFTETFTVGKM